jgi:phospholipid/cholesterol/gamma-HCH transport system substrate-binding protein
METKASYVLVGAVTLLAIIAGLGFFLWLAKVQIDRTYARYDILFDSVAGLGNASPVRFNGVDVGQVLSIDLSRSDPSRVRVSIEVSANTPVRQGTIARLESQGVTGVSFVGLEGGVPDAPALDRDPLTGVPVIPSETSVVQGLIDDAPDLLEEAISLLKDLSKFTSEENRTAVADILKNVDAATERLDLALSNVDQITQDISKGVDQIASFTGRLDSVADKAELALGTADRALARFEAFGETGLPQVSAVTADVSRLVEALRRLVNQIERDPARFLLGNRTPEYSR